MELELCPKLVIDEEFRRIEQRSRDETWRDAEQEHIQKANKKPIKLWGNIILEGFEYYEFCRLNRLPLQTQQIPVRSRREALAWACAVQLRRDDLSEDMRIYLLGKRYSTEKELSGRKMIQQSGKYFEDITQSDQKPAACKTAVRLGTEYGLGRCTIARYGLFADAVDQLAHTAPKLADLILSGHLGLTQRDVIRLSKLSKQTLQQVEQDPQEFVVKNQLQGKKRGRPPVEHSNLSNNMPIKQMPDYDPDADISGLTLTIPSWISSLQRTYSVAELAAISPKALERLAVQLFRLAENAEKLLTAIKEAS